MNICVFHDLLTHLLIFVICHLNFFICVTCVNQLERCICMEWEGGEKIPAGVWSYSCLLIKDHFGKVPGDNEVTGIEVGFFACTPAD